MEQSKFYQIKNITEHEYTLVGCDGSVITRPIQDVDKSASAFTIKDAKDGDVLVDEDNNIGIFEGIEGMCWHSYIYLGCNNRLYGFNIGGSHIQNNTKPATKEQRDTLIKAMTDAGWEFDFEKKELKKIEQKPTNENPTDVGHEYYSELLNNDDSDTIDEYAYQCAYCMSHDWMKETATWEDVQKAVKLGAEWQKQNPAECSEEDEDAIEMAIIALEDMYDEDAPNTTYGGYNLPFNKAAERLKSLKDRYTWKPSDKQINAIRLARSFVTDDFGANPTLSDTLVELEKQLKKLK